MMKPKKSIEWWCGLRILTLLSVAVVCAPGCREVVDQTPDTSSETHFLQRCDDETACGGGLSCLCGACTQACEQTPECATLFGASECLLAASRPAESACTGSAAPAACDVACARNEDCVGLGSGYRCDRGFCRALNQSCRSAETAGSEVVVLGDAAIATTHELTESLEDLARASGALADGERYRDYSDPLDNHLGGEDPGLARQYAAAQRDGPAKVVIMDGGGGDLVTNGCPDPIAANCPTIQDALAGASALWERMAGDGVEQLVFFFYPDPQIDARLRTMADTLRPLLEQACARAALPCRWVDLRPTFAGKYDEYVVPGRLAYTQAGALASATAIWGVMQQHCVAQ